MHGIGAVAGPQYRRVVQGLRNFLVPHVGRDFHDHRSAAAVFQFCKGAPKNVADFSGEVDRLGRFGERFHRLAGIEVGFDIGEPSRITHRQHEHGDGFAKALRHAAHGVFGAGAVLHAEGADGAPGGDARNRVRHVQPNALLPHHDGADVGIGRVFDEMVHGIAAENLNSLALHDFRNGGAELHGGSSPKRPMFRSACRVVGTGICRSVKRARRVSWEAQLSRFASRRRAVGWQRRTIRRRHAGAASPKSGGEGYRSANQEREFRNRE
jgi:hypothetical protein